MPYRVVNKKSPLKSQNIKDIDITFLDQQHLAPSFKISTISDISNHDFNIKIDKQTMRDAVLVKQINLKKKESY